MAVVTLTATTSNSNPEQYLVLVLTLDTHALQCSNKTYYFSEYKTTDFLGRKQQSLGWRLVNNIMKLVFYLGLIAVVTYAANAQILQDVTTPGKKKYTNFFTIQSTEKVKTVGKSEPLLLVLQIKAENKANIALTLLTFFPTIFLLFQDYLYKVSTL